ncbi:MAG: translation elongation factor Ts, partial [Chitinophagaceae bacterium]|nr:translation elongation factor Ts [Chitinophagaceae bacterium]
IAKTSSDNTKGYVVSVSSETDFVAKNAEFVAFVQSIADAAVASDTASVEALNDVQINGAKVADLINDKLASIGEKIGINRFEKIEAPYVASYIHGANRIGVLVGLNKVIAEAGKDIAMQVAALNPLAVDADSIPAETVSRERAIIIDTMKADPKMEGKPDEMIAKIAEGKLNAFFKEQTLLAQPFVKDAGQSVEAYLKSVDKDLKVTGFIRVALG